MLFTDSQCCGEEQTGKTRFVSPGLPNIKLGGREGAADIIWLYETDHSFSKNTDPDFGRENTMTTTKQPKASIIKNKPFTLWGWGEVGWGRVCRSLSLVTFKKGQMRQALQNESFNCTFRKKASRLLLETVHRT